MFRRAMILAIRFYQRAMSPLTGPSCRFTPTCSEFAVGAIDRHGALYGGWLVLKRILRCRPFGGQGYDPVPGVSARAMTIGELRVGDSSRHNTISPDGSSLEDMG